MFHIQLVKVVDVQNQKRLERAVPDAFGKIGIQLSDAGEWVKIHLGLLQEMVAYCRRGA
jgi:hypothetical protein